MYSAYREGLRISDYVYCKISNRHGYYKKDSFLVLDKKFLFSNSTRYGDRSFFEYTVYQNNIIKKIKTHQIKVLKISSSD